jgi:hypothetical protein
MMVVGDGQRQRDVGASPLQGDRGGYQVGWPGRTVPFSIFSNGFKFEPVRRWPFGARKISNKICNCMKLNKEQLFLLELFKIHIGI